MDNPPGIRAEMRREPAAGCKPWDAVPMFKAIVLGSLYNLSEEALEHEMGDLLTFMRCRNEGSATSAHRLYAFQRFAETACDSRPIG